MSKYFKAAFVWKIFGLINRFSKKKKILIRKKENSHAWVSVPPCIFSNVCEERKNGWLKQNMETSDLKVKVTHITKVPTHLYQLSGLSREGESSLSSTRQSSNHFIKILNRSSSTLSTVRPIDRLLLNQLFKYTINHKNIYQRTFSQIYQHHSLLHYDSITQISQWTETTFFDIKKLRLISGVSDLDCLKNF